MRRFGRGHRRDQKDLRPNVSSTVIGTQNFGHGLIQILAAMMYLLSVFVTKKLWGMASSFTSEIMRSVCHSYGLHRPRLRSGIAPRSVPCSQIITRVPGA